MENVQKRALRFLLNDYERDYKTLLKKYNKLYNSSKNLEL